MVLDRLHTSSKSSSDSILATSQLPTCIH